MKFKTHIDGQVLVVRPSLAGRVELGLRRVVSILPWSVGITGFFFAMEWTGRALTDTAEPSWVYGALGVSLGVIVALISGLSRVLRDELWAFDLGQRVLAWESRMPWGQTRSVQVDISELRCIEDVESKDRVDMVFGSGDRETLCQTRDAASRRALYETLKSHLGSTVEWR